VENCARINVNSPVCRNQAEADKQLRQRIAQLRRELARLEGRRMNQEYVIGAPEPMSSRSRAASASAATRAASPLPRSSCAASPSRSAWSSSPRSPLAQPSQESTSDDRQQPGMARSASMSSFSTATDRTQLAPKKTAKRTVDEESTAAEEKKVQAAIAAAFEAQRQRQDDAMPIGSAVTLIGSYGSCKSTATGSAASSTGSAAGFSLTGSSTNTPLSHYRDPHRDESPCVTGRRGSFSFLIEATPLTDHSQKNKLQRPPLIPPMSAPTLQESKSSPQSLAVPEQVHRLELESHRQVAAQLSARCAQLTAELACERERNAAERERNAKDARQKESLRHLQEARPNLSPSRGRMASSATRLATMSSSHSLASALGSSHCTNAGSLSPSRRLIRYSVTQPQLQIPSSARPLLLGWPSTGSLAAPIASVSSPKVCRTPSTLTLPSRTPSSSPVRMKAVQRWTCASPSPRHMPTAVPVEGCSSRTPSQPSRRLSLSPRAMSPSVESAPTASVVSTALPASASAAVAAAVGSSTSSWPPGLLGERWSRGGSPSASRSTLDFGLPAAESTYCNYPVAGPTDLVREALSKLKL